MKRLPFSPLASCLWLLVVVIVNGCWCHDPDVLVSLRVEQEEPIPLSGSPTTEVVPGDGVEGGGEDGGAITGDCVDLDGDGYGVGLGCLGPDCDDADGALAESGERRCYGGPAGTAGVGACSEGTQRCVAGVLSACEGEVQPAAETCDAVDNDCDGEVDETLVRSCYGGPEGSENVGVCAGGTQTCSAGKYGACEGEVLPGAEICDAVDNDCDGEVDEALVRSCYGGPAGTEGVGVCAGGTQTCSAGEYGACEGQVLPGREFCDSVDNDCDGDVDEALVRSCYGGPAGTEDVGVCSGGMQTCTAGVYGACEGQVTPAAETCDAVDNDCDGEVDEALVRSCYGGPAGTEGVGVCGGGTQTCTGGTYGACEGESLPGSETCDAVDNDCDGEVDEALVRSCYGGPAGTEGVGVCTGGTQTCEFGTFGACEGEVQPGIETCDAIDNDCNGEVDEQIVRSCYTGPEGTDGVGACARGTQTCEAGAFGLCEGELTPGAEACDAIDNDCNGEVDEALVRSCYPGPTGTSDVGLCSSGTEVCASGEWGACSGYTLPLQETCDAADNNCDGSVDENVTRIRKDGSDQDSNPVFSPVDIIVVVDNSGSMTDEIVAVEQNLNTNFASILDGSGLDYRVILIAKHGRATTDQSICIQSPLSGNGTCSTPSACPVNGPRFFHYSYEVGSHDSLAVILNTYNAPDPCGQGPDGWSGWLRPDAARFFIEITDDGPMVASKKVNDNSMTADVFESRLFALTPALFGDATNRNYVFHSIIGMTENSPRLEPWQPTDPLVTGLCTGNGGDVRQNGLEFQKLSIRTGGLRFPICEYDSFDAIFREVARGILIGSKLSCVMNVSGIPADSSLENTTLEFTPTNGGAVTPLQQVADESACSGNAFYVKDGAIHLCPDACTLWQEDPTAFIDVLFTCHPQVGQP